MLAIVGISIEPAKLEDVSKQLSLLSPITELYKGKGESNMYAIVSVPGVQELHDFLQNQVLRISAIKGTITSVLLHSYKGPRANR